ncbi:MAG: SurA N-terminal domain-containing protein [Treponema sp.]|nr:SurA N-terminal domain-containing protein [Treponema sp.]
MKKLVLSLSLLLFAGALFAQTDLQVLTVIKYNKSESITVKQLKSRCEIYEKQIGKKLSVEEKKLVLKSLTEEKLIVQAATKAGITIPDSAVDQYFIQGMSQQIGAEVTEKELNEMLQKQQGMTLDQLLVQQVGMNVAEYKAYLKTQLIAQQYVLSQKQDELQRVAPTDEEIRLFYESNKSSFVWNDMLKMFVVVVPKGKDPDAAKIKLNELRNKFVDKKISLDQLTVQSKIEGSGYQAGELLLPKTEASALGIGMPYQNLLVLFAQDEGFVSDIQDTEEDYRFVSVVKKYSAKLLAISDVVQPDTTITVYDYIRSNLAQQKQMQYVQIAAQELADSLNKPEYVEEKKSGAALDKLLDWGV